MIPLLGSVFVASVVGSLHCAGMCGAFACFCSAGANDRAGAWRAQAAYHAGRLVSYVVLGAVAGAIGARLDQLGAAAGVPRAAAILAGVLMVVWGGLTATRARSGGARFSAPLPLARALRAVRELPHGPRAFAIGLLTTWLPCGWLYAFVAGAAGTGTTAGGAAFMAAFWAGTVPALGVLALVARGALDPLRRRVPALMAALLVVLGLLTLTGRIGAPVANAGAARTTHACH
jgi:sulfite exporter TauE/SafE